MKDKIISIIKIVGPIAVAVYLVWYLNQSLSETEKDYIIDSFKNANYWWLVLSLTIGWLSHMVRGYRWLYMIEPLGKLPSFWNCYHAVMAGYVINLTLPRAGEAARAALLSKYEGLPFEKPFGTILAERVVDMIILILIAFVTIVLQLENIDKFKEILEVVKPPEAQTNYLSYVVYALIVLGIGAAVIAYFKSEKLRAKLLGIIKGLGEGLKSIIKMEKKWNYLWFTLLIWLFYVLMYIVAFQSIDATCDVPFSIMMVGFIAGSVGIVLVQGGIGVYPILIAVSITLFLEVPEGSEFPFNQDGYALGWLLWISQTLMIVVLGGLSMFLMPRINRKNVAIKQD
ncbi:MAG: flippase-like domain-containing protein [Flavobacteriales bacterium]|nr:flippase-like domain-containing protein [Flavobacteriales bacterium]